MYEKTSAGTDCSMLLFLGLKLENLLCHIHNQLYQSRYHAINQITADKLIFKHVPLLQLLK